MNVSHNTLTQSNLIRTTNGSAAVHERIAVRGKKSGAPSGSSLRSWGGGFLLGVMMLTMLAGCKTAQTWSPDGNGGESTDPGIVNYGNEPLHEGDEIIITCENVTNLNTAVKIPLSGYIDLPFIERVQAAGKTTMQLQEELLKVYASQVRAEVITVKLLKSDSHVYVSGAVLRPGKIPLNRPMTALDAVMEAGGFDPKKAKRNRVVVLRQEKGQRTSYELNLDKALKGDGSELFYLKPYDIVEVPMRTFNW